MSDLDKLASAQRGAPRSHGTPEPAPPAAEAPPARMRPAVLVGMIAGIAVVLGVAAWVVIRSTGAPAEQVSRSSPTTGVSGASTRAAAPADRPKPEAATQPRVDLAPPKKQAPTVAPKRAATRPVAAKGKPKRQVLEDIADPFQALEIYHLKRGAGDTIEIKARNKSTRGLFVRSVELFSATDDVVPLDNIGFWLPAGGMVATDREVPELSRRLGPNERVKAVINQAEFRDEMPPQLADPPAGSGLE